MSAEVKGYCPVCGGSSLFLASGGYVTCSRDDCPRPDAVADILDDREIEHVVAFDVDGFTIKHPLRERLDDALLTCDLHNHCAHLDGPPVQLGRYRAYDGKGGWTFEAVPA